MAAVRDLIMPLLRGRHPEQRRAAQGPLVNLSEPRRRKDPEQPCHAAALEQELACRNLALAIYG
jgi:hypothetical protein